VWSWVLILTSPLKLVHNPRRNPNTGRVSTSKKFLLGEGLSRKMVYGKLGKKEDNYDDENTYKREGAFIIGQL
jgi:hypothetical protein